MVGGISAVNPYAGRYAGYVRPSAALQGARSVDAVSRSAYGQPVQGVRGVGAVTPISGVAAGREVNGASTVPVPGVSAGQGAGAAAGVTAGQWIGAGGAVRGASPGTPVEPVSPIGAVNVNGTNGIANTIPFLRKGMDPAELAVRMRIQYADSSKEEGAGVDAAQKAAEDAECQTCKERKYQDGSDDAGVSFKTPTHISPDQAASAVKGHEMEHVVRERAAAKREDRRVVSQSVTMHTSICPECGRVYVSGGTTRTTTASKPDTAEAMQQQDGKNFSAAA